MKSNTRNILGIICLGGMFFIPFLGGVHLFDWDEINFAEAAREMLVSGQFNRVMINFEVFTEKPPLFFWLQAFSMSIFGINEFAARFPNAIIGIITLIFIYLIGKKLKDEKFGLIWVMTFLGSFLPQLYFKSGIIDPVFNLFMFSSVYFGFEALKQTNKYFQRNLLISGISIGFAVLTKGPVGILLPVLSLFIYWLLNYKTIRFKISWLLPYILYVSLIPLIYFGIEYLKNGPKFIIEFFIRNIELFKNQDAGHGGPFYYHWIIMLFGVFPASIFALKGFNKINYDSTVDTFRQLMVILFFAVLIIFSIVNTKIVHYSSLAYFPLTFLATYYIYYLVSNPEQKLNKVITSMLLIIGILMSLILIVLPILMVNKEILFPVITDKFALESLKINVAWSYGQIWVGILFLILLILSFFIMKKKTINGIVVIFINTAIILQLSLFVFSGKIESHSQKPIIDFCKSIEQKDCYVVPAFKTYIPYFYAKVKPYNKKVSDKNWILNGQIDKDAYIITKIQKADEFRNNENLREVFNEGGYVVFLREVN